MQEVYEALSPWCTKNMQEEQEKDADGRQMRDWVAQGEKPEPAELDGQSQELRCMVVTWSSFHVRDQVLCRSSKFGSQAVIPNQLCQRIFHHLHANLVQGGHLGHNRTYGMIQMRAWWPECQSDVRRWLDQCHICQSVKPGHGRGRQPMVTEEVGGPFERIAVDLIGPLPRTDDQMVYLLVCQDCFKMGRGNTHSK